MQAVCSRMDNEGQMFLQTEAVKQPARSSSPRRSRTVETNICLLVARFRAGLTTKSALIRWDGSSARPSPAGFYRPAVIVPN